MKAIYKRELNSYFNSMVGYVYTAVVLIYVGLMFTFTNLVPLSTEGSYPYFAQALYSSVIILVFAVPILTMKSIAEERHSKTDQLLLTYPVKTSSVILGKYFAMLTVYAIPLAVACLCPLIISWESAGGGSLLIDYSAILAFLCLGCLFVSIGMFISSLTESQIIAAVITMGIFLLLFFWSSLVSYIPDTAAATFIGFLVILTLFVIVLYHLTHSNLLTAIVGIAGAAVLIAVYAINGSLLGGLLPSFLSIFALTDTIGNFVGYFVFDLKGIVMFLSMSSLFVFLTIQSVQKRRWS